MVLSISHLGGEGGDSNDKLKSFLSPLATSQDFSLCMFEIFICNGFMYVT